LETDEDEDIITGHMNSGIKDATSRTAGIIGGDTATFRPLTNDEADE
jgi:hypothetical protein